MRRVTSHQRTSRKDVGFEKPSEKAIRNKIKKKRETDKKSNETYK